jgi:hypothetical protein
MHIIVHTNTHTHTHIYKSVHKIMYIYIYIHIILTWICLTAGGKIRSDASDLTRTLIVTNDVTRPLLCTPKTCYVTVITHAH